MEARMPLLWLAAASVAAGTLVAAILNRSRVGAVVDQLADEVRPALIGRPFSAEPPHTAQAVAPRVG